jgi:hypothetical protein
VVAGDVRIETSSVARGARRHGYSRSTGREVEFERRIGTGKAGYTILATVINQNCVIVLDSAVVVNLAKDAGGVVGRESCIWTARAIWILGTKRQAVLLLEAGRTAVSINGWSGNDGSGVDNTDEGKPWIAIDYGNKKAAGTVLRKVYNATGCSELIGAKIAARWIRKSSSVCRRLTWANADRTIIVR